MPKCSVLSQLWFLNRTSKLVSLEIMLYCIQYDICTNHCLGFQNDYKTIFKKFLIWEFTIKYAVMRMIKSWLGKMGWVPMRSPAREWLGGTAAGSGGQRRPCGCGRAAAAHWALPAALARTGGPWPRFSGSAVGRPCQGRRLCLHCAWC